MTNKSVDRITRLLVVVALGTGLFGCVTPPQAKPSATAQRINEELKQAAIPVKPEQPDAVKNALLPPLKIEMPKTGTKIIEPRFDLVVNNAPAAQVFMGIVSGTRYSMLMPQDLSGTISVNLKDVTVFEALDAIREINGFEYKVDGTRIYIQAQTLQSRVFKVNYLVASRMGKTNIQVSGSSGGSSGSGTGTGTSSGSGTSGGSTGGGMTTGNTTIATDSKNDFWKEITSSLEAIVGSEGGRSVVVSAQSGIVVVRATPLELRNVAEFLKASQLSVERQVTLEAKILEVTLNDSYQTGINWAAFGHLKSSPSSKLSIGVPGIGLTNTAGAELTGTNVSGIPGSSLKGSGGLFGLAFQTSNFAAMLSFLESQGNVHVLSSPRISTLNNQKAVLKVGNDDYFVTNAGTNITSTTTSTTTAPSITLQQFFSGVVLDVTPQIDDKDNIILHIHPSVTRVTEGSKVITLGVSGTFTLPVPMTNVSETDSIVRARDGQIVVIGGLMKQSATGDQSYPPGLGDVAVLRQTSRSNTKTELVILLKPTVVQDGSDWSQDILAVQQRVQAMGRD